MGAWYTIGLCLGLGLGIGMILSGLLGVNGVGVGVAAVLGIAAGAAVGIMIGDLPEAVAGGIASLLGALSAAAIVQGANIVRRELGAEEAPVRAADPLLQVDSPTPHRF